jgi:hypothetical protein
MKEASLLAWTAADRQLSLIVAYSSGQSALIAVNFGTL